MTKSSVDWFDALGQSLYLRRDEALNCPNCGAPISEEKCPYCGTLFVDFAAMDADKPFFMKIKYQGEVYIFKVKMNAMSVSSETADYYELGAPMRKSVVMSRNLSVDFTLV